MVSWWGDNEQGQQEERKQQEQIPDRVGGVGHVDDDHLGRLPDLAIVMTR